jgi:hypothetical protein
MTLPEFPDAVPGENPTSAPPAAAPTFDPMLVARLRTAHAALNARIADLATALETNPSASARAIEECTRQFAALRHIETIWLYPTLASAVAADAGGSSQFAELRLVGLILARRLQRGFDDLLQAARVEVLVADAAIRAAAALRRYSSFSERSIYPLYEMLGTERQDTARVA